jgi:tryptophan 6-halogenase
VYSSRYIDKQAAETELRTHLGLLDSATEARHLKMKVGRVQRSWVKNCLAVGLSQGFIEPLEATALHIVQATVEGFIRAYEKGVETDEGAEAFNQNLNERYDGIRDYIVAHYRMNQRTDSEYWRDNAQNMQLSDNLKTIMTAWYSGGDLTEAIQNLHIAQFYSSLSWHCLLAGYGTFPADEKLVASLDGLPVADMEHIDRYISGCLQNFPSHRAALANLSL